MARWPRWQFVQRTLDERVMQAATLDAPLAIANGQTISAPHMVAILLEAAALRPNERCLEIGGGSGWLAALMAELVGRGGHVVSVEVIEELARSARSRLADEGLADRITIIHGDGSKGWPDGAPYDVVILSCAAPAVPPALLEQTREGSRIIAPIGPADRQDLVRFTRTGDRWRRDLLGLCAFVPLVGDAGY